MSQLDMNQLLARLLDQVADLGAEADIIANQEKAFSLKADKGELSEYKVTSSQQIGIRLIKEGRVGIAYSESLDASALDAMVQDALDASRFAKVDPDQRITVQQSRFITDCAEIHQTDTTAVEEKIALTLRLESDMLALPDVTGAPTTASSRGRAASGLPTARVASVNIRNSASAATAPLSSSGRAASPCTTRDSTHGASTSWRASLSSARSTPWPMAC